MIKNISIKAIVWGLVASMAFAMIGGGVLGFISVKVVGANEDFTNSALAFTLFACLGLISAFISGFVTGLVAKKHEILHSGCLICIGVLIGFFVKSTNPLWYEVLSSVLSVFACLGGGMVACNYNCSNNQG